jgi:hypothetical protein
MAIPYSTLNPYSLEEFKTFIGASSSGQDEKLTVIANGVTGFLERAIARALLHRSVTEKQSGHGRTVLRLWTRPVVSVQSLTILRAPSDAAPETIAATEYRVLTGRSGGIQLFNTVFTTGQENVTVVYTAGEAASASALPPDVALLWLEVGKCIWSEISAGASAATSVSIGPHTFVVKPSWPTPVRELLTRLRPASASV